MSCLPFAVPQPTGLDLLRARCAHLQDELELAQATIAAQDEQLARLRHWDREVGGSMNTTHPHP